MTSEDETSALENAISEELASDKPSRTYDPDGRIDGSRRAHGFGPLPDRTVAVDFARPDSIVYPEDGKTVSGVPQNAPQQPPEAPTATEAPEPTIDPPDDSEARRVRAIESFGECPTRAGFAHCMHMPTIPMTTQVSSVGLAICCWCAPTGLRIYVDMVGSLRRIVTLQQEHGPGMEVRQAKTPSPIITAPGPPSHGHEQRPVGRDPRFIRPE